MSEKPKKNKPRTLKAFLSFDPEDMETNSFMWDEERDPPPLIKGKVKRKSQGHKKKDEKTYKNWEG